MVPLPDRSRGAGRGEFRLTWTTLTIVLVIVVGAALALGAFSVPWYGTEARRAVIGRAMLDSLDFVLPTHGGEPTMTKPPLFYWLEAASMALLGESRFASRVPNLFFFGLLALVFGLAGRAFGRRDGAYAIAGVLLVLTHPLLGQFGASAEMDGVFAVWTAFALFALCRSAQLGASGLPMLLVSGLCTGAAILTKGPVCLLFLLPALWPLRKRLRVSWMIAWLLVAALPLLGWLYALHGRGILDLLFDKADDETIGRLVHLDLGRVAKIPVDLAKFSLLLLPPLILPFLGARGKLPVDDDVRRIHRALLFAGVGGVLLFCFAPHRPSRYLLPAVAPLLFVLVHGSGPWLDPRARLGLALDRPFDYDIDLETAAITRRRAQRWVLCGVLALCAIPVYFVGDWARSAPLAVLILAVVAAPWTRGPVVPLLGLGLAAQLFVVHDLGRRKSSGDRDRIAAVQHIQDVTGDDAVTGWRHVPSELAWVLGDRVIFDEFGQRRVLTPWVVWEERFGGDGPPDVALREALRLRLDGRDLVLGRTK